MLVAMVLLALLAVLGTSTLNIAGIDQRIAYEIVNMLLLCILRTQVLKMLMTVCETVYYPHRKASMNMELKILLCSLQRHLQSEFVLTYHTASGVHNLGVYQVDEHIIDVESTPGYSTEQGRNGFRSDYWEMNPSQR